MLRRTFAACGLVACTLFALAWPAAATAGGLPSDDVVQNVDRLLKGEWQASLGEVAARADDETYLRRATLDLIGRLPTPGEISSFVLDPAADKRAKLVGQLLDRPEYGRNWARYWRDVILYRRTEDRALIVAEAAETYLAAELNRNTAWDQIATDFITAEGDVTENGDTAIFMAQNGETEDIASEVSRIFLGIQIQCAQCHDHPSDAWKRTQFHELAAFFPRAAVQPIRTDGQQRGYQVVSRDFGGRAMGPMRRGALEHYMPDLKDPASRGTLVEPKFFVNQKELATGAKDMDRRSTLATWITAPANPWFAKAFVNRVWAELIGRGFYEPVDDLGPERECAAPETLAFLSSQFIAHDYDIKWLYRTIMSTDAYQRGVKSRGEQLTASFAAGCPQRLRSDQLFDAIMAALGLEEPAAQRGGGYGPGRFIGNPRFQFQQVFGFDPSEARDEVAGSVPQALLLMNSTFVAGQIDGANRRTALGQLLATVEDDEELAVELYLRTLAREPSDKELATCLAHLKRVGSRREAFEDIQWALLNSTEFLHRK